MAVRLFVGNLSYTTTEADLRTYFGTVAPPSQVVLPVDRETGRPRGFAFVEYHGATARRAGDSAVQRSTLQRTAAGRQRSARARRPWTWRLPARRVLRTAAARRLCAQAPLVVRRPATSLRSVGTGGAAQPKLRTRRQTATRRQCKGQEERRRASSRSHSPQENRAILHRSTTTRPTRCCRISTISRPAVLRTRSTRTPIPKETTTRSKTRTEE